LRVRTVLAIVLAVLVVSGLGCVGAWLLVVRSAVPTVAPEPVCTAQAGGEVDLRPDQMANAATIAAVGVRRGLPTRAVQIALATALQESKLVNLGGGDRDSIGLFQQRPSQGWGQPDQLADPRFAAGAFYHALTRIKGWESMDVGDAAQAVQHSAYPQLYLQWGDQAGVLAQAFTAVAGGAVNCAHLAAGDQRGAAAVQALTAALQADWGATPVADVRTGAVTLRAPDAAAGWRFAAWLVAHAARTGVDQVELDGSRWSAVSGRWTVASPAAGGGQRTVTARVFPPARKASG
jgi:hypothetical protein